MQSRGGNQSIEDGLYFTFDFAYKENDLVIYDNKEELEEIRKARKETQNKKEDKRLYAIELRGLGKNNDEISEKLDTSKNVISNWVQKYKKEGLEGLLNKQRTGNRRNLTFEQEKEFLRPYEEKALKGELINVNEIKEAYVKLVGHSIGSGQIYYVLKRHGFRKVMPRSRHPKKADDKEIEISKKKLPIWYKK